MLELFQKGGITMYPILFLSIVSLAIFFERLVSLRTSRYVPKAFEDQVKFLLKKKSIEETRELCRENDSALSKITLTMVDNTDLPLTRLLEVAEEAGRIETVKLDKFQNTLQTIVAISPLLGLLGTVFGMIKIFDVIAMQGAGQAQELSAGIAEALITTVAGLVVAIPTQLFYHVVHARAESIGNKLEAASSKIMNLLFKEA